MVQRKREREGGEGNEEEGGRRRAEMVPSPEAARGQQDKFRQTSTPLLLPDRRRLPCAPPRPLLPSRSILTIRRLLGAAATPVLAASAVSCPL